MKRSDFLFGLVLKQLRFSAAVFHIRLNIRKLLSSIGPTAAKIFYKRIGNSWQKSVVSIVLIVSLVLVVVLVIVLILVVILVLIILLILVVLVIVVLVVHVFTS